MAVPNIGLIICILTLSTRSIVSVTYPRFACESWRSQPAGWWGGRRRHRDRGGGSGCLHGGRGRVWSRGILGGSRSYTPRGAESSLDHQVNCPSPLSTVGSSEEGSLLDEEIDDRERLDFRDFVCDHPPAANKAPLPWELSGSRVYGPSLDAKGQRERVLWGLHLPFCKGAVTVEGGAANLRYNEKVARSEWYPFENLSVLLLSRFTNKYQVSRVMLRGMLEMVRFVDDDGRRFNVDDLKDVHHEHFQARRRK